MRLRGSRRGLRTRWKAQPDARPLHGRRLNIDCAGRRCLGVRCLLEDRVARRGAIRAAGGTIDRTGHEMVDGFDVEFVTRPAGALDLNFHGRIGCAKLNGVLETSCCWIALFVSKSGAKYKRIFGLRGPDHLVLAAAKLRGLSYAHDFARAHGMRTYEPRQGRKAATVVCSASAVVTLAFFQFTNCDLRSTISPETRRGTGWQLATRDS